MSHLIYDFIAIGLGPFNLGLACLSQPLHNLKTLFLERKAQFEWHPGMLISDSTLQTPFFSDLVTMADPTSSFSFLNYLKQKGRLYPFYIRESFYPSRKEYNDYCNWAASQLENIRFQQEVCSVIYDEQQGLYVVTAFDTGNKRKIAYLARRLVLGTGTNPYIPACACALLDQNLTAGNITHTSRYIFEKSKFQHCKSVTIVGSGQSAAEVFYDLLQDCDQRNYQLNWVTRSSHFFPLDLSKLTLELTSPDYADYFYGLSDATRQTLLQIQRPLYKGINDSLIRNIYHRLYERSIERTGRVRLLTNSELQEISPPDQHSDQYDLHFRHIEQNRNYRISSGAVILGTGYHYTEPQFLKPVSGRIRYLPSGKFDVDRYYSIDGGRGEIFVQNAELHTHGFMAPDLGMGCYRNACILRQICGQDIYLTEKHIAFQEFGTPPAVHEQAYQADHLPEIFQ
ncbi:SidA/IucD/PvdA family monooxygenase [Ochrobactrum sp. SFR4]|uniref:lysine N(6)-hydroxylase/L-ornithine N(5)-oxygenase family protein n=1 Tax=Ochrobactrum sp. SFR4 TaxID=2717368 RepID=UPI001C8C4016|nr:SidA/IucD/PvdA family monooxygenase [Ochrobactrum sp. SFR4]MBX8827174.1 SidA/IucD/PvdA family monooxygenase [Ochrobactrum sp. SFR4]